MIVTHICHTSRYIINSYLKILSGVVLMVPAFGHTVGRLTIPHLEESTQPEKKAKVLMDISRYNIQNRCQS